MKPRTSTPAGKPASKQPATPSGAPPPAERELEVEKIELERAMREASRPIPGTLGGDLKP